MFIYYYYNNKFHYYCSLSIYTSFMLSTSTCYVFEFLLNVNNVFQLYLPLRTNNTVI